MSPTLWDLLKGVVAPPPSPPPPPPAPRSRTKQPSGRRPCPPARAAKPTMAERYEEVARRYLAEHGVRIRKWRSNMSGIATQVRYRDGRTARYIESPRPRGPMSIAIFLHEIGHHAIGFGTYRPRCLEEYHAWAYAIEHMEKNGLNITESVRRRMHNSLRYAVEKAERRGLKEIPAELQPFRGPWQGAPSGRARGRGRRGARKRTPRGAG